MDRNTRYNPLNFFNNQKISTRILSGYLVAFTLAVVVGALAIYQFQQVNATISRLTGQLAQERDLAEQIAIQIHLIRLYANQYIYQGQNHSDLEAYNLALSHAQDLLNEADQVITETDRAGMQRQVRNDFNNFAAAFAEIAQLLSVRQATVNDILTPQGSIVVDKLAVLRNNSYEVLDFTTAHFASQARDTFSQMQVNVIQFLATGNEQYASQVDENFSSIKATYDLLQASVHEDASRQLLDEIKTSTFAYHDGFQNARTGISRQHELTSTQLETLGPEIDKNTSAIANDVNLEFIAQSQATSALVHKIQNLTVFTIILVVIVSLIFGWVLSRAITRPIQQMANAAQGIAGGAFDQQVEVMGKDELGVLAVAFNDMTSRVRETMAALGESRERYLTLFETANDVIFLMDGELILECNLKTVDFFRCENKSEIIGRSPVDFSPEFQPDGKKSTEKAQELIRSTLNGIPQFFYWKHQRKDRVLIDTEVSLNSINLSGKYYLQAIVRDITQRKQAEDELQHEAQRSAALARITTRLNASLGLDEVLASVCEEIAVALDAPITGIWLKQEDDSFCLQAAYGAPSGIFSQLQAVPIWVQSQGQELLENIYFNGDVQNHESPNRQIADQLGLNSALYCHFYHEGQLVGNLAVYRYELDWHFSDADLLLLHTIRNQVAIAIHNAQLFEQVKVGQARLQAMSENLVEIQEAERRHLAIELHDEIGQGLTHIKMSLDRFDPAHPEKASLDSAREIVLDLMNRVRSLSLELRPTILDDLGLLPAVLWHIERYTSMTGFQVDFKSSGADRRFRPQVESTAYRILQESLTNIARYANASRVTVSLWADDQRLGLQVEDNGVGFDLSASLQKMTGGLSGMLERARICGGQLLIDARPGQGTYISLELPLSEEQIERSTS